MGMDEYIEKDAAIAVIISEPPDAHYPHWYADKIKSIPAADVAPVRHGRWEYEKKFFNENTWYCSCCQERRSLTNGTPQGNGMNYCPNCGARMDEKNE